jgi:PAS domain S-box-containing protein
LVEQSAPDGPDAVGDIAAAAEGILIVENAPLALVVVHPSGRVAFANRALRHLLGYEGSDLAGHDVSDLVAQDSAGFARHWAEVLAVEVMPEHTAQLRRRDGSSVQARVASLVMHDGGGAPRLVLCRVEAA